MKRFTERAIVEAFARIEEELLASMVRNLERHRVAQIKEGKQWERWQIAQLTELERYTRNNLRRTGPRFDQLNKAIDGIIENAYDMGLSAFEKLRLRLARLGLSAIRGARTLLGIPVERLDSLVEATHRDMMKAEYSVFRQAHDIYRQVIFDASAYATSGAATYAQAIDMATKDYLAKGITGITYRNGSKHSIREYSQMAVRTASKRAALVAEGGQRREWETHTVFVPSRPDACPECMAWMGQVLVDDVYSGGTAEEAAENGYALLSEAMAKGLLHPNCRDTLATYYPGITTLPPKPSPEQIRKTKLRHELEGKLDNARQRVREYNRLAKYSLDPENRRKYKAEAKKWRAEAKRLKHDFDHVFDEDA